MLRHLAFQAPNSGPNKALGETTGVASPGRADGSRQALGDESPAVQDVMAPVTQGGQRSHWADADKALMGTFTAVASVDPPASRPPGSFSNQV